MRYKDQHPHVKGDQALQALHKKTRLHKNYEVCTKITRGCLNP
jgi:hypothetical protein